MKAHVLLRAGSISSVITQNNQTGSILSFLWSVNLALATFWGFEVYTGDASGQSQDHVQE